MVHIVHNLDPDYQGRIYLDGEDWTRMAWWTELPDHYTIDKTWSQKIINPSRCAILSSDQWATVSKTYQKEIQSGNSLSYFLNQKSYPFAYPNGIDDGKIRANLAQLGSQRDEKIRIIQEFFGITLTDANVDEHVLFGFVGRICQQKGVHLILETAEEIFHASNGKAFFIVGGMVDGSEYSRYCQEAMKRVSSILPNNFWGKPNVFFTQGLKLNRAADFFLMPSMFEPGGIVQHEALIAGTPVIAFRTGGLNDSIEEFRAESGEGNGFLFHSHDHPNYVGAVKRALAVHGRPADYARLRANCGNSFISIKRVTKAWRGEFYRMLGKVAPNLRVLNADESFDELRAGLLSSGNPVIKINDPHFNFLRVFFRSGADNWKTEHHLSQNQETGEWTCVSLPSGPCECANQIQTFR